jgi:hypothetical protein
VRVKLPDFKDLSPVEQGLVDWLRAGNRRVHVVPDTATKANTFRDLALGQKGMMCPALKPVGRIFKGNACAATQG